MKLRRSQKSIWAFVLTLALVLGEFACLPVRTKEASAAGYQDVTAIPATGSAIEQDGKMEVKDLIVANKTVDSVTLNWNYFVSDDVIFYIYKFDTPTQTYAYVGKTSEKKYICKDLKATESCYYTVCAYNEKTRKQGFCTTPVLVYPLPAAVTNLKVDANQTKSIQLSWNPVEGATGYQIYRTGSSGAYALVTTVAQTAYTDINLKAATTYRYKVRAYSFENTNCGAFSAEVRTTTTPATPALTVKGGDERVRLTWKAVSGASGYYVYCYNGASYQLLARIKGKSTVKYIHTGLTNGTTYSYQIASFRIINSVDVVGTPTAAKAATTLRIGHSSLKATLFRNKSKLKKSAAYKGCKTMKKSLNYSKSFATPGMASTNIAGFQSKTMCPQGITFAKSYCLITAYDRAAVENSVIYVLSKNGKKLLTTIALPNKTHAGGIAFDGTNVWITQGYTVRSIPFSTIQSAAKQKKEWAEITAFKSIVTLTHQAATLTYYKKKLWVASYNELQKGYLGAYTITGKTSSNPGLSRTALTRVPTRVQGIAFTSSGKMILSRSCQTDAKQRGFLHVLSIYKPKIKAKSISLGKCKKTVDMPTMNEEIAINGSYLYVNFESVSFSNAIKRMDRVCAFKISKF